MNERVINDLADDYCKFDNLSKKQFIQRLKSMLSIILDPGKEIIAIDNQKRIFRVDFYDVRFNKLKDHYYQFMFDAHVQIGENKPVSIHNIINILIEFHPQKHFYKSKVLTYNEMSFFDQNTIISSLKTRFTSFFEVWALLVQAYNKQLEKNREEYSKYRSLTDNREKAVAALSNPNTAIKTDPDEIQKLIDSSNDELNEGDYSNNFASEKGKELIENRRIHNMKVFVRLMHDALMRVKKERYHVYLDNFETHKLDFNVLFNTLLHNFPGKFIRDELFPAVDSFSKYVQAHADVHHYVYANEILNIVFNDIKLEFGFMLGEKRLVILFIIKSIKGKEAKIYEKQVTRKFERDLVTFGTHEIKKEVQESIVAALNLFNFSLASQLK